MSKKTKSQPADFRMCPIPGVANSATSVPSLTLRPSDLGAATQDWVGRSQWTADPAFDGEIDDLRIYASALSAGQITTIYNAR